MNSPLPLTSDPGGHRTVLAGFLFAFIYAVAFVLLQRAPGSSASEAELRDFYGRSANRAGMVVLGLYLVPFAGIAFMWFLAAFRDRVIRLAGSENTLLATVQLLSGAIYVAMLFSAAAAITVVPLAIQSGALPIERIGEARLWLVLGDTILVVFALRAAAVFMAAGTTRGLRSGLFPKWFGVLSYILVVALVFTISSFRTVTLIFPAWIATASALVLARRRRLLREAVDA